MPLHLVLAWLVALTSLLNRHDRLAAALTHATFWFATIVGPLVVWLLARRVPRLRIHAAEAFNFQVTWAASLAVLGGLGYVLSQGPAPVLASFLAISMLVVWGYGLVQAVSALLEASTGRLHRYRFRVQALPDSAPRRGRQERPRAYYDANGRPVPPPGHVTPGGQVG